MDKDYEWNYLFLFGIWNLWIQRNQKAFKAKPCDPNLLRLVEMQVREFIYCVANSLEKNDMVSKEVKWAKPAIGWHKLNTGGSFNGASGLAGCGELIRDSNGQWVKGFAKRIVAESSLAAELWGLREGLVLCLEIQTLAIEVELDATAAISLVSCNSRTNGPLSGLADDCRELLLQMPQVKVSHCFREANSCADALAKMGAAASDGGACFVSPPFVVNPLLHSDCVGLYCNRWCPFCS